MHSSRIDRTFTPVFSSTQLEDPMEIKLDKTYTRFLVQNSHHEKARLFFAQELFLLALSAETPTRRANASCYKIAILLEEFQDEDFANKLSQTLLKHFKPYSSLTDAKLTKSENALTLMIALPIKILDDYWDECFKSKPLFNNPQYYIELIEIINEILAEISSKQQTYRQLESLSIIELLLEKQLLIMRLIQKIQFVVELSQDIKNKFILTSTNCENIGLAIQDRRTSILSREINVHFKFQNITRNIHTITPMVAKCIANKVGFLGFLKHKKQQTYESLRDTDYRITVLQVDVKETRSMVFDRLQHAILILKSVEEPKSDRIFTRDATLIIESSHYDPAQKVQAIFVNNISLERLDLHGFDVNYSKRLANSFLKHHFLNFKTGWVRIDVGKASHSPDQQSRLGPSIKQFLIQSQMEASGFIERHDDYNQATGLIGVRLPRVILTTIDENLTLAITSEYDAAAKKIPTGYKKAFLQCIKSSLTRNCFHNDGLYRLNIVFAFKIKNSELLAYLRDDLLKSQLQEMFPLTSIIYRPATEVLFNSISLIIAPNRIYDSLQFEDSEASSISDQNKESPRAS